MRIALFCHSLLSDWNHGNAHFLRGVVSELSRLRHEVLVYEPEDAWSVRNLVEHEGEAALRGALDVYPAVRPIRYRRDALDLARALDQVSLVWVHEWTPHELVARIGAYRAANPRCRALFHDTHHRAVTDPSSLAAYDLRHYDGVLAFGAVLQRLYLERGWTRRCWVWHEAADPRVFHPPARADGRRRDLVWIGNWGDGERSEELNEFLLEPAARLRLDAVVHGVRYPAEAREALDRAGVRYAGWLPNYRAPEVFAQFRTTVHVPRRAYLEALRGIPTIRVFEALACGIPLVCRRWDDVEQLFSPGEDFLVADTGEQMTVHLRELLHEPARAAALAAHGLRTITARHTCAHRARELLDVCAELGLATGSLTP